MSFINGFDLLLDPHCSALLYRESALWCPSPAASLPSFDCALEILTPPASPALFDLLLPHPAAVLRRLHDRSEAELHLQTLSDRVAALELNLKPRTPATPAPAVDRTYKWTAEIKGAKGDAFDRKYKLIAHAKAGEKQALKWTTEIKGRGKDATTRIYTFRTSSAPAAKKIDKAAPEKKDIESNNKKKAVGSGKRVVEIEDEPARGTVVIRKTFAKRAADRSKGKTKEMSPQDAALLIQMCFRSYLARRSQVLRALRELAVAKAKLKELRGLFANFSYRSRVARDAEEKQRFSEKIIVLLLTVDSIEGPDYMVRAAKKSMIEELEMMLQVIDPQPSGKLASFKRRKFDLPEGGPISKELSVGVAQVVQMIDEEDDRSN